MVQSTQCEEQKKRKKSIHSSGSRAAEKLTNGSRAAARLLLVNFSLLLSSSLLSLVDTPLRTCCSGRGGVSVSMQTPTHTQWEGSGSTEGRGVCVGGRVHFSNFSQHLNLSQLILKSYTIALIIVINNIGYTNDYGSSHLFI